MLSAPFRPDGAERDEVLRCFQKLVDNGFASWWLNEAGGTELHFANGKAFLLQDEGIVCLRRSPSTDRGHRSLPSPHRQAWDAQGLRLGSAMQASPAHSREGASTPGRVV